ncbi:MAG: gamma-glutamyl-gamma-aminobutyrate hydrolase family protein [Rhodospirillales bacterium]|nr:gamma-glutamyl-gamma-aminobutyrate hydrolase family protein [Rhodospirillales bacterium]
MRLVAVSQRVEIVPNYGERRDALDQRWPAFLAECGLLAVPVPNHPAAPAALFAALPLAGVLLTGGNDLAAYGGDAPERDETESRLLDEAERRGLPALGVCRGMQMILHRAGAILHPVSGHVTTGHPIRRDGAPAIVNSYHCWGATRAVPDLAVVATAEDGVIEAVRHRRRPVFGMMWHPERDPDGHDRDFIAAWFKTSEVET